MKNLAICLLAFGGLVLTENETGGRGQTIDPPAKKSDHVSIRETGGVKIPPDGKKLDLTSETGGYILGG